jgi:hypothetical protein
MYSSPTSIMNQFVGLFPDILILMHFQITYLLHIDFVTLLPILVSCNVHIFSFIGIYFQANSLLI